MDIDIPYVIIKFLNNFLLNMAIKQHVAPNLLPNGNAWSFFHCHPLKNSVCDFNPFLYRQSDCLYCFAG